MTLQHLEALIIEAYASLSIVGLNQLDDESLYSSLDKEQIIEEIKKDIKKIKGKKYKELNAVPSSCYYCYPSGKAYEFFHQESGDFVIRIVIEKESDNKFIVEECRNRLLESGDNGLPF